MISIKRHSLRLDAAGLLSSPFGRAKQEEKMPENLTAREYLQTGEREFEGSLVRESEGGKAAALSRVLKLRTKLSDLSLFLVLAV